MEKSSFKRNCRQKERHAIYKDCVFQLLESDFKVEGWLSQQEEYDNTVLGARNKSLHPVRQWKLDHVQADPDRVKLTNRFTISESGAIGITCKESPSLSVMYPDTDKPPVILSNDMIFRSAIFVKLRGKEQLAAAHMEDGCLHLWDIESKRYMKVFDPKLPKDQCFKGIKTCKIDENTIGYGEAVDSLDDSRSVFILKTDTTKEWTLCGTVKLMTPYEIHDICHKETLHSTPCLLLCVPSTQHILVVEMENGETRWEVGKEQIGEKFEPWSICTDQNDCVYIADWGQKNIHLLSATDRTLIKSFDVRSNHGINNIVAVRFHDQHLYVEWRIHSVKEQTCAITKLKQIKEM